MPIHVEAPNGDVVEFPDGTTDDVMSKAMQATYGGAPKAAPAKAAAPVWSKPNAFTDAAGAVANFERGTGVGDELAAGLGTAVTAVGDVATGKQSPVNAFMTLGDRYQDRLKVQRNIEDDFSERHPVAGRVATGLGIVPLAAIPGGEASAAVNASRVGNMARGGLAAATTAAAYAAADRGTLEERGKAATAAGLNPFIWGLGAGGGALAPSTSLWGKGEPKPVDANVAALSKEGVQMTPGQIRGGLAKDAEDLATSLPILGPSIKAARSGALDSFNRAAINRALAPIGETLPAPLQSGYGAVKYAGDKLSAAYERVLPEVGVVADTQFGEDIRKMAPILDTLTAKSAKQLQQIVDARVMKRLSKDDQVLDGSMFKQVESELDNDIRRFSASTDADQRGIGEALSVVKDALTGAASRQNPKFAAEKAKIDAGWANLVPVEKAAASTAAEGGVFTPKQYDVSVKSGSDTVRKRGYARGEALGEDLSTAGQAVLPSKVGDSGTAGRAMIATIANIPGVVAGTLSGGPPGALLGMGATGLGLTAATRMYTESAIAAGNKALQANISAAERGAAMKQLADLARQSAEASAIYREVISKLPRAAGIGGAVAQAQQPNALAIGSR